MATDRWNVLTEEQIFTDIKKITAKLLRVSDKEMEQLARLDSALTDELGLDSIESLDLRYSLESFYSLEISDEEAARLIKVSDVINLILEKKGITSK